MFFLVTPRPSVRRRPKSWLRWCARVLFAAGIILLGYVALVLLQAKLYDADAEQYVNSGLLEGQARTNLRSDLPKPESVLSEGEIIGRMEIPRLGVSAAVLQGTASRTLRLGVGHIRGTAIPGMPGNSAIAGHRDTFFRALKDVRGGDEIELKTADNSTRYLVDWARVVAPADTSVLDATNESVLTLVTCYPFYFVGGAPKRFVVRAHRVPTATLDSSQAGLPAGGATQLSGEME